MTMSPTSTALLAPLSPTLSDSDTSLTTRRERQRAFDALNGLELSPTSESRSRRQSRRISAILHESPDPSSKTDDATKRITPTLHASLVSEILSLRREVESRNNLLSSHEETIYHLRNSNTSLLDEIAATNKTTRNLKAQVKVIEGGTLTALEEIAADRDELGRLLKESRARVENLKGDVRTIESEKTEISALLETERAKNARSEGAWKRKCELAESRLKEVLGEVEHVISENVLLKSTAVKATTIVEREDEDTLRRSESLKRPPLVHSDSLADELARLADEEDEDEEQGPEKPLVSPTHPPSPPITPKVGSSATMEYRATTTHDIGVQVSLPSPSPTPPPVLQKPMLEVPFISIRPPSAQSRPPTSSGVVLPPGTKSVATQTSEPYPELSSSRVSPTGIYTTKSTQTTDLSSRVAELLQKASHNGPTGTLVKTLRGVNLDDSDDLDVGHDLDLDSEESESATEKKTEKLDKGKGREVIVPIPASVFPGVQEASIPTPAAPESTEPKETVLKPKTSTSSFLSLSMPFPVPDRSSSRRLQSSKKKSKRRRRPTLDTNDFSDADAERDESPSRKIKRKSKEKTLRRMPSGLSSISGLSEISGLSQLSEFTSDFTGSALGSGSADIDVDVREFGNEDEGEKLTGLGLEFEPSLGFADVYSAPQHELQTAEEIVDAEEIRDYEDLLDEEDLSLPPAIASSRTEIEQRNRDSLQIQAQILDRSTSRLSAFGSPTSPQAISSAFRKPSAQSMISGPPSVSSPTATSTGQSTIVDAIAQTMIGDWLWKYTRRRLPGLNAAASDSQNLNKNMYGDRHQRWVWLAPYEKCVMWSARQPTSNNALLSGGKGGKRLVIQSVLDVRDDSLLPSQSQQPGPYTGDATEFGRSIVIITPSRALKFTAPNKEKHFIWMTALSFLAHSTVTGEGLDSISMPSNPNSLALLRQSHLNKARPVVTAKSIRDSLRLPRSERDKLRKALDENDSAPSRTPPPPPTSGTSQSLAKSVEEIDPEIYNVGAEPPVVPRLSSRDDNGKAMRGQNAHTRRRSLTNPLPILGALNRLVSPGSNTSTPSRPEVTQLNALGNGSKASLAPSQPSTLRYVTNTNSSGSPRNASKISIVIPGSGSVNSKGASTTTIAAVQASTHDRKEHESPISPTSTTTSTGTGRSLKEEYARLDKIGRERRRTRRMHGVAVKV